MKRSGKTRRTHFVKYYETRLLLRFESGSFQEYYKIGSVHILRNASERGVNSSPILFFVWKKCD